MTALSERLARATTMTTTTRESDDDEAPTEITARRGNQRQESLRSLADESANVFALSSTFDGERISISGFAEVLVALGAGGGRREMHAGRTRDRAAAFRWRNEGTLRHREAASRDAAAASATAAAVR